MQKAGGRYYPVNGIKIFYIYGTILGSSRIAIFTAVLSVLRPCPNCSVPFLSPEVTLQKTFECLSVSGLVPCHLVDGIMDGVKV